MATPSSPAVRTVHVRIEGRVQAVGFRAWVEEAAGGLGLDGWVRNRRDGAVEAVFGGDPDAVGEMLRRCERGPPAARVSRVEVLAEGLAVDPGFRVERTV
ncbi:MAG: acylphosphatase [Hyphomicrobiaceae bacterium]|nr:acylphosphatase [Hyphomicrobiaceae bacterium]